MRAGDRTNRSELKRSDTDAPRENEETIILQGNEPEAGVRKEQRGQSHRSATSRPGERMLAFAYFGWLPLALLTVGLVIASIPTYIAYLHLPRVASALAPADPDGQLTPRGMQELQAWGVSLDAYIAYLVSGNLLLVLSYLGVGTLIIWRAWGKTRDVMALCAAYLLVTFPVNVITLMLKTLPPTWEPLINILSFLGSTSISLFVCLFPTGRFAPRWTGWLALASTLTWGIYIFVPAASSPSSALAAIIFVFILLSFGGGIVVQVYRYRRLANQVQRQQSKWVFFGLGIMASGYIVWTGLSALLYFQGMFADVLVQALFNISQICLLLLIPLSLGFAILRYRLWDIDVIINRTLVYGALTASIIGIYVLVVGYLGALFRASDNLAISLFATGCVAVLFQPLRGWLQRGVNRFLYGQRDEPYTVITRMSQRLEVALAHDAILPTIVETVAAALKLPAAVIELARENTFEAVASYGKPAGEMVALPLTYQGETVGQLRLSPRAPGEAFTPADRRLLGELARHAGLAAHAVRLTTDLQRSRERIVTAREEERRRLRRDLHDGLGATLAALHLQAGAVRSLMRRDLGAAEAELLDLQTEIRAAVTDIRRLVYALRPPALDELGLVEAIRQLAAQQETPATIQGAPGEYENGLHILIEVPAEVPAVPAAVEVATYRVVQEALTNVVRHAHARTCRVRFAFADALQVEIADDGVGFPAAYRSGVGLLSLRERAEELGGSCSIESTPGQGTRVLARLPLPKE